MLTTVDHSLYRTSFNLWLRTGLWVEPPEEKGNGGGNPYHDPANGQFTFGPGGSRQNTPRQRNPMAAAAPTPKPKPAQTTAPKPTQPSPRNIAHGANASARQSAAKLAAVQAIQARLATPGVSPTAAVVLENFLKGVPDPAGGTVYRVGSAGSNEVRDSAYGKELHQHVQAKIAARNAGIIPDGDYLELLPTEVGGKVDRENNLRRFEPYRSAGITEFVRSFGNDVNLMDVIGSFTLPIKVTVKDGVITYQGVNKMGLRSFAAQNFRSLIGLGGGVVDLDAGSGELATTTQIVYFQVPVALNYRRKRK